MKDAASRISCNFSLNLAVNYLAILFTYIVVESLFIRRGADYSSNDLAQPFEVIWNNRLSAVDKDSCPFVS